MAGDWIPMQVDLHQRLEVIRIAALCKCSQYEAVGMLLSFWGWMSRESVDGHVDADVDALVAATGLQVKLFDAMVACGWLIVTNGRCEVPNWERWMSSGAKTRLQKNMRQKSWRGSRQNVDAHVDGDVDARSDSQASTTEEKRTEQNRTKNTPPPPPPPPQCAARGRNGDTRQKGGIEDGSGSGGGGSDFRWEESKEIANQLVRAIGKPAPADGKDRRLIIQAAYLSLTKFDEQWLSDAIEDTRHKRPGDTWRYLRKCLDTSTAARGENLDRLLALTKVPQQFLTAKPGEVAHG